MKFDWLILNLFLDYSQQKLNFPISFDRRFFFYSESRRIILDFCFAVADLSR